MLNQIVIEKGIGNCGEILAELSSRVYPIFHKGQASDPSDGMDISMIRLIRNVERYSSQAL